MDLTRFNNINELKELLELLTRYEVREFELETEGRKIHLGWKQDAPATAGSIALLSGGSTLPISSQISIPAQPSLHAGAAAPGAASPASTDGREALPPGVKAVASPMVGTFYRAPSPEADPFVQVGDRVEEDTVICLIEAMKVMNEIQAGIAGVIKDILVKNGESVEFGQTLVHISAQ